MNDDIFLNFVPNIDFGCFLEQPQLDNSNEYHNLYKQGFSRVFINVVN